MALFDAVRFREQVTADVGAAAKLVSDLEHLTYWVPPSDDMDETAEADEQERLAKESLREVVRRIQWRLGLAFELNGLTSALSHLRQEMSRFKDLAELERLPYVDVLSCPALGFLSDVHDAFSGCLPGEDEAQLDVERGRRTLEQILAGTAKLITDRKMEPTNEAEVRREVYGLLLHTFPDTTREVPIPQVSKTYKPDIGVKSLKTAVEYKFVDTEAELKTAFEGIYADTKGYGGSADWTHFFAVIYCTKTFWTPAQLKAECDAVGMPANWQVLLMTGDGKRRQKSTGDKNKPGPPVAKPAPTPAAVALGASAPVAALPLAPPLVAAVAPAPAAVPAPNPGNGGQT